LTQPLRSLEGVSACVFDAYGTLFDFAPAAARCADVPAERRAALTSLWRDKQLQYTWLRTLEDRYADFWQVTGDALDFALESPISKSRPCAHLRLDGEPNCHVERRKEILVRRS
jgi:2-haloacid dehalogenase